MGGRPWKKLKSLVAAGGFYLLLIGIRSTLFGFRKWLVLVMVVALRLLLRQRQRLSLCVVAP
jgi:hypothetical protein